MKEFEKLGYAPSSLTLLLWFVEPAERFGLVQGYA
jgi:hypothetical protein